MKPTLAIACSDVSFAYKGEGASTQVLEKIALEIQAGEFVAIQGSSGSGKSTLLYLLGLLAKPDSGSIRLFERETLSLADNEISRLRHEKIGFIFQQFHLLSKASVLENVLLPLDYEKRDSAKKNQRMERALSLIAKYGLQNRIEHYPNQLSGGQQQRVAIARALLNEPDLILADEPTGNLDSKSAELIFEDLRQLNIQERKTIVLITHDRELANRCDRIIHIKDGKIEAAPGGAITGSFSAEAISITQKHDDSLSEVKLQDPYEGPKLDKKTLAPELHILSFVRYLKSTWDSILELDWSQFLNNVPKSLAQLQRQKFRSFLTMLGISVGVAAVFSMITLGAFTKEKILAGYAELGVNSLMFYGYRNWDLKATDKVPATFQFFNWSRDLKPLQKIFNEIELISPLMMGWSATLSFAGKVVDQDVRILGVSEDAIPLHRRRLLTGRNFIPEEIERSSAVCIIGFEIGERLFLNTPPLGQVLNIKEGENSYSCRIIGVLESLRSNKEYLKPNLQVILPFTFYQVFAESWRSAQIKEVLISVRQGENPETVGNSIRAFFEQKYGASGNFRVDSDTVLISQMNRFLTLFTILLSAVAMITLIVGGMGITNMMLVSVSERYREIGLRRALGATSRDIRTQFLSESLLLCLMAGGLGMALGFIAYSAAIWAGTKFLPQLSFEWTINFTALSISIVSIAIVGILSGLFPAIKAERLQVIEALRAD